MNLYLLTQTENRGYDTYDSAVVVAPDAYAASRIMPGNEANWCDAERGGWAAPEDVAVHFLGVAADNIKQGVVLASFNAG